MMLLFAGCHGAPPAGAHGVATQDLLVEAYGGCTATGAETDREIGALSTRTMDYDENGDLVRATADYIDDAFFSDWAIDYTRGEGLQRAPADLPYSGNTQMLGPACDGVSVVAGHQAERVVADYATRQDWSAHHWWDDGHVVRSRTEAGPMSWVDEYGYEGDHLVTWTHELDDGSGEPSRDVRQYTWTDHPLGWLVSGNGRGDGGRNETTELRDPELRLLEYHFFERDDVGTFAVDWVLQSYSALGIPGDSVRTYQWKDWMFAEEREHRTSDELGRPIEVHYDYFDYDDDYYGVFGSFDDSFDRTITWTYDCP